MASTINNQASTTYQFSGSSETTTSTSNLSSVVLQDGQGLTLTKTATPISFAVGDIITYSVTITNNSSSFLTGVRIIDDLGGGNLAYVVGSGSLTTSTQTYPVSPVATNPLTFALQQLGVGATMTLTYRAQVIFNLPPTIGSITNNVRGIGYTSTGTINGFANTTIQKKTDGDLVISKSASSTDVLPYQVFSYTITLSNGTDVQATAIETIDQLPSNFVLTSVSLRVGLGNNVQLSESDYVLLGTNALTIPSSTGPIVTVPANGNTIITITGYFTE